MRVQEIHTSMSFSEFLVAIEYLESKDKPEGVKFEFQRIDISPRTMGEALSSEYLLVLSIGVRSEIDLSRTFYDMLSVIHERKKTC